MPPNIPTLPAIRLIASFEPGESWFYDYETREMREGDALAPLAVASGE